MRSLLEGLLTNAALQWTLKVISIPGNRYLEPLKSIRRTPDGDRRDPKPFRSSYDQVSELDTPVISEAHLMDHNRLCRLVGGVLGRLMHSSGSAYEQDTSFAYGPLQLLAASAKADRQNSPADWHLFYHTTFIWAEKPYGNGIA